jgi:hypothetical protein
MKIEWNRVTWYSRVFSYIVFLIIIPILALYIFNQYEKTFNILGTQKTEIFPF